MLRVKLCGKNLKSPLILGSGALGETKEPLIRALDCGAGAVVSRSLRASTGERKLFNPAYFIEKNYMLNADNQNITPWTYWVENAGEVEKHGPLAISLSARDPESCRKIVAAFEKNHAPSFYELNFSCSHSAKLYGRITYGQAEKALRAIKKTTDAPVLLKLSLDSLDLDRLKKIDKGNLADAFVLSNTIGPGMKIDVRARKPALESVVGGVSGPAIKPLVLAGLYELRQHLQKPLVGVGGIESASDALEFIILGCDAVQVYTKIHRDGLESFQKINDGMKKMLKEMGETIESLKGSLKSR